jgi:hypothetical protein
LLGTGSNKVRRVVFVVKAKCLQSSTIIKPQQPTFQDGKHSSTKLLWAVRTGKPNRALHSVGFVFAVSAYRGSTRCNRGVQILQNTRMMSHHPNFLTGEACVLGDTECVQVYGN